jgi:hypothetical protein
MPATAYKSKLEEMNLAVFPVIQIIAALNSQIALKVQNL